LLALEEGNDQGKHASHECPKSIKQLLFLGPTIHGVCVPKRAQRVGWKQFQLLPVRRRICPVSKFDATQQQPRSKL
jgi:hypothetical protein